MAEPVSIHFYRDPDDGEPFARKLKYAKDEPGPNFGWEHRIGWDAARDWAPNLPKGLDVGLYGQGRIEKAKSRQTTVHITEGEKDADRFAKEYPDRVVVSRPHGARSWNESWHRALRGVPSIVVHADDDSDGIAGAARAAHALKADGFENVRIALPAEGCKDVYDHLEAGHGDGWRVLRESAWPTQKRRATVVDAAFEVDPDSAAQHLLGKALQAVLANGRNDTGFGLAMQLRDAGLSSAAAEQVLVSRFAPAANALAERRIRTQRRKLAKR